MKLALATLGLCALGASCSSTESAFTYTNPFGDDHMAQMQAHMQGGMPGPEHQELAKSVGSWNTVSTMHMPGQPSMTMKGTADIRPIFGGRFLIEDFKAKFDMGGMSMPFEGMLVLGYSNVTKEYTSLWIGSTATEFSLATGRKNAEGHMEMAGTMTDIVTPEGRPTRLVSKHLNDNHFQFEMYDTLPDGSETLVMEIEYTRR